MDSPTSLGPLEYLPERPFTHPQQSAQDLEHVTDMLVTALEHLTHPAHQALPLPVREFFYAEGRRDILRLYHPERLLERTPLHWVGFRGYRRPDADPRAVQDTAHIDEQLEVGMAEHSDILAYNSRQLPDGNYLNLVVLQGEAALQRWHAGELHQFAVRHLAPEVFGRIRLHRGRLPQGLWNGVALEQTQFFDHTSLPAWRGLRVQIPLER